MDLAAAVRALDKAHSALHNAFANYPLRGDMNGCLCCVSADDHKELQSGNLRRYASKAVTTWGDEADFKHFLPVLVAALTPTSSYYPGTVHGGTCDLHCLASKLAYVRWQAWPATEQQALLACFQAWWVMCLALVQQDFASFLAGRLADGWSNSVEPAYQELSQSGVLSATWLWETWRTAMQPLPNQSSAAYVQSPAFLLLVDWLYYFYYCTSKPLEGNYTPAIRQYLEDGFFYYADFSPGLAQRLSNLLHYLEHSTPLPASSAD